MSLILDALNKADQERNRDNPPSLSSQHSETQQGYAGSGNSGMMLLLGGTIAILALALIYFVFIDGATSQNHRESTQQSRPVAAAADQKPREATSAISQDRLPRTQEPQKPAKSNYDRMREKLIAAQYQQARAEEDPNSAAAVEKPKKEEQAVSQPTAQASDVADIYQQSRVAKAPRQAQVAGTNSTTPAGQVLEAHPEVRFIGELPYSIQKNIPTIMYTAHNFRNKPASVTLNNSQRRQGQTISNSLVLEEILENGIILRYESRRFKMSALNSWVNM